MKRFFTYLIVFPLALVLIALAITNRSPVTVVLDPFAPDNPALSFNVPLFLLVFGAVTFGVLIGGLAAWFSQGRHRKAARQVQYEAARFRREADELKKKLRSGPSETDRFLAFPRDGENRNAA